jgi:hypothetical protein
MLSQQFGDILTFPGSTRLVDSRYFVHWQRIKTANERKVQNVAAGLSIHILQTEGVISGLHFINAKHGAPSCQ